jgi:hypothetical protein
MVGHAVAPAVIPQLVQGWLEGGAAPILTIDPPPHGLYGARAALIDVVLRGLHAWRCGVPRIVLPAPWWRRGGSGEILPEPTLAAWHTLAERLSGRTFVEEIALGEGLTGWLITSESGKDAALIAWARGRPTDLIATFLGDGPVRVVDAFGNERPVALRGGVHEIHLDEQPVIIEHIDAHLAAFRARVRLDPQHITSAHRVHEHALILSNPWDAPLSGTVRLRLDEGCHLTPRWHRVALGPHETIRLPVTIVPERGAVAGSRVLQADFELNAGSPMHVLARIPVELGWEELEVAAQWRLAMEGDAGRRDLIVQLTVTNRGREPLQLDAFIYAPALSIRRQTLGLLQPGQRSIQTFHIEDGAALLAGADAHIGVAERDGARRLTQVMPLPAFGSEARGEATTEATTEAQRTRRAKERKD